jgi:hypothetical protein
MGSKPPFEKLATIVTMEEAFDQIVLSSRALDLD